MSTALAWRLFELGFRPWMASRVRTHLAGLPVELPRRGPLLMVANHESFWDGFLMRVLQRTVRPRASFHAVMLDRELGPRPLLRALGGIGITPGSLASGRRLIRRLRALDEDSVVAFFPQGVLRPGSPLPLGFARGVEAVGRALEPAAVLPVGIRLYPGRTSRTEAYMAVGAPLLPGAPEPLRSELLEASVTEQIRAIDDFVRRHGEASPRAWPDPHEPLPRDPTVAWAPELNSYLSRN